MYDIQYETVGGAGEPTTASAALMVPSGFGDRCTGARPVVLYAHGTTTDRKFNMTNPQNAETLFLTRDLRIPGLHRGGTELRGI